MAGINGVICIDKPQGFTSFDVIAKLRGMLKMRRLGHSGTLDPMATGVLPVFAGTAAKAADMIPDHDKEYRAGFCFGYTSDTLDSTGKVVPTGRPMPGEEAVRAAALALTGEIDQIPPMYSAVSVNGKRLYELARRGIEIEREPRRVTVYRLDVLRYDKASGEGELLIACSKGTYIRSIIDDMGRALGCGGIMTSLIRTKACSFTLDDCYTLEQVQATCDSGDVTSLFRSVSDVFDHPCIRLDERLTRLFRNGVKLTVGQSGMETEDVMSEHVRVFGFDGEFLAIARIEDDLLVSEKNFYTN